MYKMARVTPIGYTPKKGNTKHLHAKVHNHLLELYNRLARNGIPFNVGIHKNLLEQANHLNTLLERRRYPHTTRSSMRELGRAITAGNKKSPNSFGCLGKRKCKKKGTVTPYTPLFS